MPNSYPTFEKMDAHLETMRFEREVERINPDDAFRYSQYRQTVCPNCPRAPLCDKSFWQVQQCLQSEEPIRQSEDYENKKRKLVWYASGDVNAIERYIADECPRCELRLICTQSHEKVLDCISNDISDAMVFAEQGHEVSQTKKLKKGQQKSRWQAIDIGGNDHE